MQSPFPWLTDTLGSLGSLALAVTAITLIIGAPVILALAVRFLWSPVIRIRPTPELWAMLREWQHTTATNTHHEAANGGPTDPRMAELHRGIANSMFGR